MSFRLFVRGLLAAGLLTQAAPLVSRAQPVDPAVVSERLQRLSAAVESLEMALASQRRQIEALSAELQQMREEAANRDTQRPWAEDMKRLNEAIAEVDRKRVADGEQVLKVLNDLRKTIG